MRWNVMVGLLLVIVMGMTGCGGGGGSSPVQTSNYTGTTSKATVTTSNAKALSEDAFSGGQLALSTNVLAKAVGGSNHETLIPLYVSEVIKNCISAGLHASKSTGKSVASTTSDSGTIPGYSGSASYSINADTSTGSISGSVTFSNFKPDATSAGISGHVSFTGNINVTTGDISSLSMAFSGISASDGSTNYSMNGTVAISASGLNETLTISMTLYSSATQKKMWIKNYSYQYNGSSNTLTCSGTYYDPAYGYVVMSTIIPLYISDISGTPTSGQLLFTGENNTKARLTFTTSGYRIEADTTGSGTFSVVY